MKIINTNDEQSGVEKIMKYCSELTQIFGYPYFFNWSASTNHRDIKPIGEISDVDYVIFRCGVYPQHDIVGRFSPVEKQLMFGSVNLIVNNHTPMRILASAHSINIESMDDVKYYIHMLKSEIDNYLHELVVKETNDGIDIYNKEYAENMIQNGIEPVPHVIEAVDPVPYVE